MDFRQSEFPEVGASGILGLQTSPRERELRGKFVQLREELMRRDGHIDELEREIDSLRSDVENLQAALEARKAELALRQQQDDIPTVRPSPELASALVAGGPVPTAESETRAVAAMPVELPPPEPPEPPRAPEISGGDAHYPLLQQIQLTHETPKAGTSVRPRESESPLSADERRSAARRACAFEIEFTEEAHFFAGLTQDISEGGLFVATYHLVPVGTRVILAFDLPNGRRISAHGEVRWIRTAVSDDDRPGIGVAFTDVSPEAMRDIAAFCAARPPLYIEM